MSDGLFTYPMVGPEVINLLLEDGYPQVAAEKLDNVKSVAESWAVA